MEHSGHSGHSGHRHPETFDEVIEQGFPHEHLETLAGVNALRARDAAASRPALAAAATTVVREDQARFSSSRQTAFRNAVVRLVEEGAYLTLVKDHMDMSHRMHGTMGEVGLYRFLGWHRRYLVAMERELQRVDRVLRPGATDPLAIPYWRWQDPFPSWLVGFLPQRDPVSGQAPPQRKVAAPPPKANAADIDIVITQFAIQKTGLCGEYDYTKFTFGVEGFGLRPDGSRLPAHNNGHAWVGGIMNNTSTSPTDPVFWFHHAEVDRLWHIWRQAHPTPRPRLSGADLVMDPWAESYDALLDVTALGYTYDSLTP